MVVLVEGVAVKWRGRTVREWALYLAGTLLFLVWDSCKRIRGHWRRREWRLLLRVVGVFLFVAFLFAGAYGLVAGGLELGFHIYQGAKK